MNTAQLRCDACLRSFSRLEHLQRHLLTHTESRGFRCNFCPTGFNRRDALIRHWRTCRERLSAGQAIPSLSRQKRGRKQIACDRCVQRKRACTQTLPCNGCIEHRLECTYLRCPPAADQRSLEIFSLADVSLQPPPTSDNPVVDLPTVTEEATWIESAGQDSRADVGHDQSNALPSRDDTMLAFHGYNSPPVVVPSLRNSLDLQSELWSTKFRWDSGLVSSTISSSSFAPIMQPKLAFLARFTSTHGIANSFDCGNPQKRKHIMMCLTQFRGRQSSAGVGTARAPASQALLLDVVSELDWERTQAHDLEGDIYSPAQIPMERMTALDNAVERRDTACAIGHYQWLSHTLARKTHEIVMGIKEVVQYKNRKSPIKITWSQPREMLCYRFFSPENLERFLLAFWAMWYPNWPVFHKPTFVAAEKPSTLLASMALIGASLTSEAVDRDQALLWADAVEEWVFSADALSDNSIPHTDDEFEDFEIEAHLNALRAAYAAILFLTWEGSQEQKKRARRIRFTQVVAVARSLRFSATAHESLGHYTTSDDQLRGWKKFILREELNRALTYVFLIDCAYVMFNNCVPRMVTLELQLNLACPEAVFQAETVEMWLHLVGIWSNSVIGLRQPLLSDVIDMLTRAELCDDDWTMLQQMSSLNFFAIINAFHNLIFHRHCGSTHTTEVSPITQGLMSWRKLWISRRPLLGLVELHPEDPCDAWKRIGFMQYAEDFWSLAYIVYKQPSYLQTLRIDGSRGPGGSLRQGLLESFDDSSMGQVHELIIQSQGLNFGEEDLVAS